MKLRAPGGTVAGKYVLEELIARGGMGSVWRARETRNDRVLALKFMDAPIARRNALARFEQEAKAAAAIQSAHVITVLDFGKDEKGHPYLAMELLDGEDLERRLTRGKLSLDEVRVIVDQACSALARAHEAGYVHRDLKPENVFLCSGPTPFTVKLLDFGLAKDESSDADMTGTNEVLGTPHYMSPEQARGRDVDLRTDLYSLGVLVFACLTDHLPYEKVAPLPELIISITTREPALISVFRPDLPAGVVTWMARALQKEPDKRFASAAEMAERFAAACAMRRLVVGPRSSVVAREETDDTLRSRTESVAGDERTLRARTESSTDDHTLRATSEPADEGARAPSSDGDDRTLRATRGSTRPQRRESARPPAARPATPSGKPRPPPLPPRPPKK